ncbi:MAG TPA: YciI family protein [Steroidobacteraceae bacterium]
MQYAILCYDSESLVGSWSKERDDEVMANSLKVKSELAEKGRAGPTVRLMPTTAATTVRTGGAVIDGPFAETKEQLLGFYVVECNDLNEAIEIAQRLHHGSGSMEIRPIRALWNPPARGRSS